MAGMTDDHTHFSWTDSGSSEGLADLGVEEHTLFAMRSVRTFLDCGYTSCLGVVPLHSGSALSFAMLPKREGSTLPRQREGEGTQLRRCHPE